MDQTTARHAGTTATANLAATGRRTFRIEERHLPSGTVDVLACGLADRDAVVEVFTELVGDEAARPRGRYRAAGGAYRLLVVADGIWTPQPRPEATAFAPFAGRNLTG